MNTILPDSVEVDALSSSSCEDEDTAIARALAILQRRLRARDVLGTPGAIKDFLRLQAQGLAHEVFGVMYLDSLNRLLAYERMFRGTLSCTSVHQREVVKQALSANAAAVIFHHNHPSGNCEPSVEDVLLTLRLKSVLALVDVEVLDHLITSDSGAVSMAERGLI